MITSASNEQIKPIIQLKEKSKVRKQKNQFVVEGIKMFSEIPDDQLVATYVSESFAEENKYAFKGENFEVVSDSVFKKISDTVTPQGIMAIVEKNAYTLDDIIENVNNNITQKGRSCVVVLDRLQDPGNLGTIVRTGEGAGISGIIMSSGCADIYNPKVIRSTMGSIFRVPFTVVSDLPEAIETLKENSITTYAAHLKGEEYNKGVFEKNVALLIGNEAKGLSDEVSGKADRLIKIPMEGKVESLNAAIATAILMYQCIDV